MAGGRHDGRRDNQSEMAMIAPIRERSDWRGTDLDPSAWLTRLEPAQADEVRAALAAVRASGKGYHDLTREDFPLPTLAPLLAKVAGILEDGIGFQLVRGFPVDGLSKDDLRMIFWGLGKHLGTAVSQSSRGDLIGDVRDMHLNVGPGLQRGYNSNVGQGFHTDSCDVSALFVLRQGISGGDSRLLSAVAVHNEMLRLRPDLVALLYEPFYWSWQGQQRPGELPYYQQPVFSVQDGKFCCRIIAAHIHSAQAFPDVPRLTAAQCEAIALVAEICARPEFHVHFKMEPGDLEIMNSHVTFHGRTTFEDGPTEETTRHLLRMWLAMPGSRPLSPLMGALYRDQRAGAVRGGFPSTSGVHLYETKVTTD
ncbi:MAG: TauD/TfdA family dioxygenase [Sphingomonas bacterium]|nr:TauD/TfdA family dioxygenase [Sphingomonas bacterium]